MAWVVVVVGNTQNLDHTFTCGSKGCGTVAQCSHTYYYSVFAWVVSFVFMIEVYLLRKLIFTQS